MRGCVGSASIAPQLAREDAQIVGVVDMFVSPHRAQEVPVRQAAVAERAGNFQGRPVGDIILRGRSEPLRTYEPLLTEAFKAPATAQYSQAFAKLEAGDASAMPAFAALVGEHADDPLAGFHLKRLLNGAKGVSMRLE